MDVLGWIEKRVGQVLDWICRARTAAADRRSEAAAETRSLLTNASEAMRLGQEGLEADWLGYGYGLSSEARSHAMRAEELAHQLPDEEARRLLLEWKTAFDTAPGHNTKTTPESEAVRARYQAALGRLGQVVREV